MMEMVHGIIQHFLGYSGIITANALQDCLSVNNIRSIVINYIQQVHVQVLYIKKENVLAG